MPIIKASGLASALEAQEIELQFAVGTPATGGTRLSLIPTQATGNPSVALTIAGSTSNASLAAAFTQAQSEALVAKGPTPTAREIALAAAVRTMVNAPAATADGARSVCVAVGGLSAIDVQSVQLIWASQAATGLNAQALLTQASAPLVIAASDAIPTLSATGTPLAVAQAEGVIVASLAVPDIAELPASGAVATLKIKYKG